MNTVTKVAIILLAALLLAGAAVALAQTPWAAAFAEGVVAANQATMMAAYETYQAQGAQPAAGGHAFATAGNLARIAFVAAVIIAGSLLQERRARAARHV